MKQGRKGHMRRALGNVFASDSHSFHVSFVWPGGRPRATSQLWAMHLPKHATEPVFFTQNCWPKECPKQVAYGSPPFRKFGKRGQKHPTHQTQNSVASHHWQNGTRKQEQHTTDGTQSQTHLSHTTCRAQLLHRAQTTKMKQLYPQDDACRRL